jgi:hypothetical protein
VRIWDVSPGYLDRQRLLGEHRELHGLHSILVNGKRGYSRHPETRRWAASLSGLCRRHEMLVGEMRLRGYSDRTPVARERGRVRWPATFVTEPAAQFALLKSKHGGRGAGRIPLPHTAQELWAQHKFSVLARDQAAYRALGRRVSAMRTPAAFASLADDLVRLLRASPPRGELANAVEHMWGFVSRHASAGERRGALASPAAMFLKTCELAVRTGQPYLLASTALADLAPFVRVGRKAGAIFEST